MSWAPAFTLFLNTSLPASLQAANALNDWTPAPTVLWTAGNKFPLNIYLLAPPATPNATPGVRTLPVGYNLVVKGKDDPASISTLFDVEDFAQLTDGNGNTYYQAVLDLNTSELLAALAAANAQNPITVYLDIDVVANDGSVELTVPLEVQVRQAINDGGSSTKVFSGAFQLGTGIPIPQGADTIAVVFGTQFANPPAFVWATVVLADGTRAPIVAVPIRSTLSATGCTFALSGEPPDNSYTLAWVASNSLTSGDFQFWSTTIMSGNNTVAVVFDTPFDDPPSAVLPLGVTMPDDTGAVLWACPVANTFTTTGATLALSGAAPASGYKVNGLAFA